MVKSIRDIEEKIENDMIQRFEARVEYCALAGRTASGHPRSDDYSKSDD